LKKKIENADSETHTAKPKNPDGKKIDEPSGIKKGN
jgi:hypothetical protein